MIFINRILLSVIILLIAIIIFSSSWSLCYKYNNDIYSHTIDSLTAVIAVKQRQQDSLTSELSQTNAKMLKAVLSQIKHIQKNKKISAEISGRLK